MKRSLRLLMASLCAVGFITFGVTSCGKNNNNPDEQQTEGTKSLATILEAIQTAIAQGTDPSTNLYQVKGTVESFESETIGIYKIKDETGMLNVVSKAGFNELTSKPKIGNIVTLKGQLNLDKTKNNAPTLSNAEIVEIKTSEENPNPEDKPSTSEDLKAKYNCIEIPEALEKAKAAGDTGTTEKFAVYGKITKIVTPAWGNMVIGEGENTIFAYGPKGWKDMQDKPEVGDEIVLKGVLKTHDGKPQMFEPEIVETRKPGQGGETKPEPEKPNTGEDLSAKYNCIDVKEAKAKAEAAGDTGTTEKFNVYGKIKEVKNSNYGNLVIEGAGATLYVRGGSSWDALETKPVVGNEIVLKGILKTYQGHTPQIFEPEILEFR